MQTVVFIILGVFLCFWGYKSFRLSVAILGAYGGYSLGGLLCSEVLPAFDVNLSGNTPQIISIIVAIVLGLIAFKLYESALMWVTALVATTMLHPVVSGFIRGAGLLDSIDIIDPSIIAMIEPILVIVLSILLGFILGLIVLALNEIAIKLITAACGGYLLSTALLPILMGVPAIASFLTTVATSSDAALNDPVTSVLWLFITAIGFVVQFKQ